MKTKTAADNMINASYDKMIDYINTQRSRALTFNQEEFDRILKPSTDLLSVIGRFQEQIQAKHESSTGKDMQGLDSLIS